MLDADHLLRARPISLEANDLIRDILHFHSELRLSIPEISSRVLHLRSFFGNPRTISMKPESWETESTYKCMHVKLDPIARRRKELEHLRRIDRTSAFNDFSDRLPSPQPPLRRIRVCNSPQQPRGGVRPHRVPVSAISPPVTMCPERPIITHKKWLLVDSPVVAGVSWHYI